MKKSNNDTEVKNDAPKHIRGICCDVNGCSFNEDSCYCTADKVNIGPCSAKCSPDTVCSTFKPKNSAESSSSR